MVEDGSQTVRLTQPNTTDVSETSILELNLTTLGLSAALDVSFPPWVC